MYEFPLTNPSLTGYHSSVSGSLTSTLYPLILDPPSFAGGIHVKVTSSGVWEATLIPEGALDTSI